MRSHELLDLDRQKSVFIFPVGGFEDRGPDFPLGFDAMEAEFMAKKFGEKLESEDWKVVLVPPFFATAQTRSTYLGMKVRAYVVRDYLVDSCVELGKQGFRHFVVFGGAGLPRQLVAIEEAGKIIRRRLGGLGAGWLFPFVSKSRDVLFAAAGAASRFTARSWTDYLVPSGNENGGRRDASIFLAMKGEENGSFESSRESPPMRRGFALIWGRFRRRVRGGWGSSSLGTRAEGQYLVEDELKRVHSEWKIALASTQRWRHFRSWFGLIPLNRVQARGWLYLFATILIVCVWSYWIVPIVVE